ncbi:MAG: hypothetical protein JXB10_09115 [Pirellulales bacterium]|nr:hypothetical protein [Pirellulales bacterium]
MNSTLDPVQECAEDAMRDKGFVNPWVREEYPPPCLPQLRHRLNVTKNLSIVAETHWDGTAHVYAVCGLRCSSSQKAMREAPAYFAGLLREAATELTRIAARIRDAQPERVDFKARTTVPD